MSSKDEENRDMTCSHSVEYNLDEDDINWDPHACVVDNKEQIMQHFREILHLCGFEVDSPDLKRTPERQWEVLELITRGYTREVTLERMYQDYGNEDMASLRICPGIKFISVCEHHFMPFYGTVDIAYVPKNNKVTGLSKLPQLVEKYALRPQIQERMNDQIADELMTRCDSAGVLVIIRARHMCEIIEGYWRDKPYTTSRMRGLFAVNPALKEEALDLIELSE